MKVLPKYHFDWSGFFALFLGGILPIFLVSFIFGLLSFFFDPTLILSPAYQLISTIMMWAGAIFAFDYFICRRQTGIPLNFNFSPKDLSTYFLCIPMLIGMMFIVEVALSYIPTKGFFFGDLYEKLDHIMKQVTQDFGLLITLVVILAPLLEEIVFRGIIQKGLINRGIKPITAIWIASLLFGVIHLNPWQFVGATLLGYVLGIVYHKTKSLLLPITLHFINNLVASITYKYWNVESFSEWFGISNYLLFAIGILLFFTFHYLFLRKYKSVQ